MYNKERDTVFSLRIPKELKKALENEAAKQDRSLNNLIVRVLKEWLRSHTQ